MKKEWTDEEKLGLIDRVGYGKSLQIESLDWVIFDRYYWNSQTILGNFHTIKMFNKMKEDLHEYRRGDLVSIKELHKVMMDEYLANRLTKDNLEDFRWIIMEAKGILDDDYEEFIKEEEDE